MDVIFDHKRLIKSTVPVLVFFILIWRSFYSAMREKLSMKQM